MRYLNTIVFIILLFFCSSASAQLPGAYRLKAMAHDSYSYDSSRMYLTDSFAYYYSNNRQGFISQNAIAKGILMIGGFYNGYNPEKCYDSCVGDAYDVAGKRYPRAAAGARQRFDANGNISIHGLDSYFYSGNKIIRVTDHYKGKDDQYSYDAFGRVDTIKNMLRSANGSFRSFTYDVSGNLIKQTYWYSGSEGSISNYSYNTAGQLVNVSTNVLRTVGGSLTPHSQTTYHYDTAGDVELMENQQWDDVSANWRNYDKQHYWYDAMHKRTVCIYAQRSSTGGWDTIMRYRYAYNTAELIDNVIVDGWDAATQTWAQNRPDTALFKESANYRFYYEANFPTDIVADVARYNVTLYPSPASGFIRVDIDKAIDRSFTAAVYDMQGNAIRNWVEPSTSHYSRSIPVTELPAGVYFIKFTLPDGQVTKQFTVMR